MARVTVSYQPRPVSMMVDSAYHGSATAVIPSDYELACCNQQPASANPTMLDRVKNNPIFGDFWAAPRPKTRIQESDAPILKYAALYAGALLILSLVFY